MPEKQDIERRRAALSDAQRALLERRLRGQAVGAAAPTGIRRRSDDGTVPLSFPQQRLWFLDHLMPGNAFYNEQVVLPIRFALNVGALERTINEIIRRHEVLRTRFVVDAGQPMQIVEPGLDLPLPVIDLRGLPEQERQMGAQQIAAQEVRKPFDLASGPLLRTTLLQLADVEYILLLTIHHIASDGWSMQIVAREMTTVYAAFASGRPSPLAELPIQYADFAVWQRQWLQGPVLKKLLSYWKERLEDLPTLQLPTDRPRPPIPSFQGAQHAFALSSVLTHALKELSQQRRVTLFMTVLAAFAVLLHLYTDQDDIVIGSPIANRNRAKELEGLIGFFVNTLILRLDVSDDPTFLQLLDRVREVTLGAQEHQDMPFEKLVEELQPERDLSRNPLCQVAFQLFNVPGATFVIADPTTYSWQSANGTSKFDLRVDLGETPNGLAGLIEYSTDLFTADTVARMTGHFRTLLEAVAAEPGRRISEVQMLTSAERRQLLIEWNTTEAAFPDDRCLHQIVEAHARKQPEAVAAVFGTQQLTYGELNRRANHLAGHLQSLGVGPETLVGLCMHRSLEMLVGFLGTLKAGGAYVPLDPAYPPERLQFMLEDAQVRVLLTQQRLNAALPENSAVRVPIDGAWEQIAEHDGADVASDVGSHNVAYVIYTSGSTGRPKGVLIEHRGLLNLAQAQVDLFQLDSASRVLQFSSLSFDASIFEIVMAWYSGVTLYLGTRESLLPGPSLAQFLHEHAISIVTLPPSALVAMPNVPLPALTTIAVAGEACPPELVATWAPGRRFFNLYGPTEATIWSTYAACAAGGPKPPIGRPIANTQVYVLDRYQHPVPIGIPGELYVSGVGVAREYLKRPELTAGQFVPNPFRQEPGARFYKTGDLVRYLPDGNLEFLGRTDYQVKIRGFRIEMGEIEAMLARDPAVGNAVVLQREDGSGDKYLAAYVVARQGVELTVDGLRDGLRRHVPEYMVPARIMVLDTLPLLPSGKVDRHALPNPDVFALVHGSAYVPPQTAIDQAIANIWQEVLSVERVGMDDNFFDLGGHSLLLARVHNRLTEMFDAELSMLDLFRYPTVGLLARRLSQDQEETASRQAVRDRAEKQKEALRRRRQRVEDARDRRSG